MQENYISLDPDRADSMTAQQRSRLWSQRVHESCGGDAGRVVASQFAVTSMICSYTLMRNRGFRITPFGASKFMGVGGILLAGFFGWGLGSSVGCVSMGNSPNYYYLLSNRRGIINGSAPFDVPKNQ